MSISKVKAGDMIEYIGDSWAYEGIYTVITAESTYSDPDDMTEDERNKLMIIHLTNSDLALCITLDKLNPKEWKLTS